MPGAYELPLDADTSKIQAKIDAMAASLESKMEGATSRVGDSFDALAQRMASSFKAGSVDASSSIAGIGGGTGSSAIGGVAGHGIGAPSSSSNASTARAIDRMIVSTSSGAWGLRSAIGGLGSLLGGSLAMPLTAIAATLPWFVAGSRFQGQLGDAQNLTGGTPEEVSGLTMLGGALGQSPGAMGAQAMNLANALHGGTYGGGYMRSHGVVDLGPTQVDKASNLIKALKVLSTIPDENTAVRVARDTGLSEDLWVRDLPQSDVKDLLGSMSAENDPRGRRLHAEAMKNYSEAKNSFLAGLGAVADSIGAHPIGGTLGAVAGGILGSAIGPEGTVLGAVIGAGIGSTVADLVDSLGEKLGNAAAGTKEDPHKKSQNIQDAIKNDPRTTVGPVGLGTRGSNAVPLAWKNQQMDDALQGATQRLGGYNL